MDSHNDKVGAALVIGSGIAGMQASLDLANSGIKVYLVEKSTSIGGTMPQLDKTFPTNDCAMCMLAPKLVDTGRHPNIEVITRAQVEHLEGKAGHFKVRVKKAPRFVDEEKCTGCGDCAQPCPVEVTNEFDEGLSTRKAIFKRYPQANPNAFAIDKKDRPPCKNACPAGVNCQGYVALISQGKFKEALELIRTRNPLPATCGRICHHPCEQNCNRDQFDEPVAINYLKRFVADYEMDGGNGEGETNDEPRTPNEEQRPAREEKVAVIGSGPAGLTAALDLSKLGYPVTMFEAMPELGGMLRSGIPTYRLPKDVLQREIDWILSHGIEVRTNTQIGRDLSLADLEKDGYRATFVAIGAGQSRMLRIEGVDHEDVLGGVDFLRDVSYDRRVKLGRRVIVIGGGNVAMDVARTALRQKVVEEVHVVCLESLEEMPAHPWEIEEAEEEGVLFHRRKGPKRVLVEGEEVAGLETIDVASVFDETGRFNPSFIEDTEDRLDGDTVIIAIGQMSDFSLFEGDGEEVEISRRGTITVDPITYETGRSGLFAGGDMVNGPASAVEAINTGHEAAISIDRYLRGEDLGAGREPKEVRSAEMPDAEGIEHMPRHRMPTSPAAERAKDFRPIELGFTEEMAIAEAKRCLNCGICSECFQCVEACKREALDHEMTETTIELEVGTVILALGFDKFDAREKPEFGYGRYPNVLTSIEFERLLSASGPYMGHVRRPSDLKEPKKVAWIQCVGSRDVRCHEYCSSVCCMYATKEAVIAKEHVKGLEGHIYFMDMRAFGKDFDRYYERAKTEYGVEFRRSRVHIEEVPETKNLLLYYETEDGTLQQEEYGMVVLSTALEAPADARELSETLGIGLNEYGFIAADRFIPAETTREGIYACGAGTEPKDIPETVTQASAAASRAAALIGSARGTLVEEKDYPAEVVVEDEEPRIGVFVCHCGINIGGVVDVPEVVEFTGSLPNVVHAEHNLYTCSQDTQMRIKEMVAEHRLNRVIVASCTPRTHEPLFQDTIREAGLNPYLFELANIRDQCSWVHREQPEDATLKAKELVAMAVAKSRRLRPLQQASISVVHKGLVIGGGPSGLRAALDLADQGFETFLIEKEPELGGHLRDIHYVLGDADPQKLLQEMISAAETHPLIHVYTNAEVRDIAGYVGNYTTSVHLKETGQMVDLEHGAIITATGARAYEPTEYLYGQHPKVVTQHEVEARLANAEIGPDELNTVVMIQCVGSRDEERPYCSRVCCSQAIKNALRIKTVNPDANVFVLYRDIRTYGFKERYYRQAREMGVVFIRHTPEKKPKVYEVDGVLKVAVRDLILNMELEITPDLLVLSTGIVPNENGELARLLKVPLTSDGFFLEAHAKLRPVDFAAEGLYLCGLAHSPRFIEEALVQASGAAARAAALLSRERLEAQGIVAQVSERQCLGCGICVDVCEYDARKLDEELGVAQVIEVLCQGCGACATACPSGATQQNGFMKAQILSMIEQAA